MKQLFSSFFFFVYFFSIAQDVPIGAWRSFLPCSSPIAVADAGDKIFCANSSSFYSYQKDNGAIVRYSKVNGLSDIGISTIAYNMKYKILVVAYQNSNMDLISETEINNVSDLKRANITGDKTIYHIDFIDNLAYLSCGFGIVVMDILKNEIKDTYYIGPNGAALKINAVAADGINIFAATKDGLYSASLSNPNLANYNSWKLQGINDSFPSENCFSVVNFKNRIYAVTADSFFVYENTKWKYFYSPNGYNVLGLSASYSHLVATIDSLQGTNYTGYLRKIMLIDENANAQQANNGYSYRAAESVEDNNGTVWIPDFWLGFGKNQNGQLAFINPNSPITNSVSQMAVYNNQLWMAPGTVDIGWHYQYNRDGFASFIDNEWTVYNNQKFPGFTDTVLDIINVAIQPSNNHVFFGSYGHGLIEYNPESNKIIVYQKNNSPILDHPGDPGSFRIGGITFDKDENLWICNPGTATPLSVKKPSGEWIAFSLSLGENPLTKIISDMNNNKWILLSDGGLIAFNHGSDLANSSDDTLINLKTADSAKNLSTASIKSIAEDLEGEIWLGTNKGVFVFYCASDVFYSGCEATQPLVLQDKYYGYLLENETVNAIAVDGANRKWFGTNKGAWLMSADGQKQILHFDEDNSPLPSGEIKDLAINNKTGEVFFGTSKGICSYRSDATLGGEEHGDVYVFPNPVRKNYQGTIAITGLVQNAFVKITDIAGNLVYQTKALGGQAVWDGKNYKGEKPITGVYLVFSSSEDGSETYVSKFLIVN